MDEANCGTSAAIRRTLDLVGQVAPTGSTVLRLGETGTGKERFAAAVHDGLYLWAAHRIPPGGHGDLDGRARDRPCGHYDGAWRMTHMRDGLLAAFTVFLASGTAWAQATTGTEKVWSFYASASTYILPDDPDFVQPAVTADRGWLHLEGRFNYEDRNTGSAWFGYNFSVGETVTLELTPMIGAVFGQTGGIAPGYRGSLSWGMLQFYSETELVVDTGSSGDSFLYTWSEFEVAPADWCRFGLVLQRTKVYETEFDIQRGFFAGVSYKRLDVTAYVFNPDAERPTVVVTVGVGF
jgi:hypothetical protein